MGFDVCRLNSMHVSLIPNFRPNSILKRNEPRQGGGDLGDIIHSKFLNQILMVLEFRRANSNLMFSSFTKNLKFDKFASFYMAWGH